jgi:hypothetical protein
MDYDINMVQHGVWWKQVSSCLSIQIAKLMSSDKWSADPHHTAFHFDPDPPFTLMWIRIRIIAINFMQIRNQILPFTFFTDLDPPTQCSRITFSQASTFSLWCGSECFSLWCGSGSAILPTCSILLPVYYFVTSGEDCWLYENNLQWD